MLHSKLFNHGPLTRRLLPLLIPQRAVKSLVLLGVIFTTIMAGRMGDGGSVAAAPSQTAAPATINVRVVPASPGVMSGTVTMAIATTMTVGVLIQTLGEEHNLVSDGIRLLFEERALRTDEVIANIPLFRDGFTLILQYLGPAVAAVGAAAASAANQAREVFPVVAWLSRGSVSDGFLEGLPFCGWNPTFSNCQALYTLAHRAIQNIHLRPPRKGRDPPYPSKDALAYIRICIMILNLGYEGVVPFQGDQGNLDKNKMAAITGYYTGKGHPDLNDDFVEGIYNNL